jgi:hypothetical protein
MPPPYREKVFGPGRAMPLDRNAKCRVLAFAKAWSARHRQPGQHKGPITRTFLDVLEALLWSFHNSRTGACYPAYETIAAKADCHRSTVAEALKALEWAGVLTWQNRITRILVCERDLFGQWARRWQVVRTSNAYVFRDPKPVPRQIPTETPVVNQIPSGPVPAINPNSPLERALARFGVAIAESLALNKASTPQPAT